METIQLCLASPSFFPTHGGAQLRFLRYLPGLRERGIHSRVFSGTPRQRKLSPADRAADWFATPHGTLLPTEDLNGSAIQRLRLPDDSGWQRNYYYLKGLLDFCKRQQPQVLQLLSPLSAQAIPCLWWLRRQGISVVYAHTLPDKESRRPLKRRLQRAWQRAVYQQVDHVVANSEVARELLRDLGVNTPLTVIPNGVDLDRFQPANEAERRGLRGRLGLDTTGPVLVTVGAVSPRKGSELLLGAWREIVQRHPTAQLVLVGPRQDHQDTDRDQFSAALDALLAESGARERVHFVGQVSQVVDYLRAADVFVFPSRKEGMPNAVLEAMACGLPVVNCPFVGLSPVFGREGEHYLLAEHRPDAIAAMVNRLLADPGLGQRLGCQARDWLVQHLSLATSLDRYATLYRQLASR